MAGLCEAVEISLDPGHQTDLLDWRRDRFVNPMWWYEALEEAIRSTLEVPLNLVFLECSPDFPRQFPATADLEGVEVGLLDTL